MPKRLLFVALAILLVALPVATRWLYYYEGRYAPQQVTRPNLDQVQVATTEAKAFADRATKATSGTVLIDLAHGNRFDMTELHVLQDRLASRGQRVELITSADDLARQLRYAQALVEISPGEDWTAVQIQQVEDFVDKGGRLVLVSDPTRYAVEYDEFDNPILDEDVPHLNDLASRFGLLFQPDYLYNTSDNAGNFRNIKLTGFAADPLTQGLEQVVFYATRSITSQEPTLIFANGQTQSSASQTNGPLAVAVLAADGKVLALGDLTFMVEPNNASDDNNHLIANIADFIGSAERQYNLVDFPYFFSDQADLVYTGDPLLDSDLLAGGSALQALFAGVGKELTIREAEDRSSDTLFFGLYQSSAEVEPYLEAAQVTLVVTPTVTAAEEASDAAEVPAPQATEPPPAETEPEPGTEGVSSISPPAENRIRIESMGEMVVTGTLLLVLENDDQRQVMVMLADTQKGLGHGIERLTKGDLTGCIAREMPASTAASVVLCQTGEVAAGEGGGGWQTPKEEAPAPSATPAVTKTVEPAPTAEPVGEGGEEILIVSLDQGEGEYGGVTSADQYAAILQAEYGVSVWSRSQDGLPQVPDLRKYDLVIWTAGDFKQPLGEEESNLVFLVMLEGIPVILSGAYVTDATEQSAQSDIQVKDATHPMASGFKAGEVIAFDPPPPDAGYQIDLLDDAEGGDQVVVFVRGPASEDAGAPSIYAFEEEVSGVRVAIIGVPLYWLPDQAGSRLVLNTVDWMLNSP